MINCSLQGLGCTCAPHHFQVLCSTKGKPLRSFLDLQSDLVTQSQGQKVDNRCKQRHVVGRTWPRGTFSENNHVPPSLCPLSIAYQFATAAILDTTITIFYYVLQQDEPVNILS